MAFDNHPLLPARLQVACDLAAEGDIHDPYKSTPNPIHDCSRLRSADDGTCKLQRG
jgi:hypothetical protein